ncbi:MAG: lipoate--protein ligase family protein [Armatimonadota bacterium]|nr:lipoate--protein ligase family protein [Armatimonadota bacterium]
MESCRKLRLVCTPPADGFANMAVDEALFIAHAEGWAPPTLRLYSWRPPALSIGYFQSLSRDVDAEACARAGVHVVRRLTGGRAVLHADEITYSIVLSEALLRAWVQGADATLPPFSRAETLDPLASYRVLCGGLIAGLRRLGLEASLAPAARGRRAPSGADCFAAAAGCDLVVNGKKICGSAQLRRGGVILQHGSLLFSRADAHALWRHPSPPANATNLTEALGFRPQPEVVARALADGFAEALAVCVEPGRLDGAEECLAEKLRHEKYATPAWNLRR